MYSKILIAKHNLENKCFANDGEVLTIVPRKPNPIKDGKYYFIGSQSKEKSQYGWVVEIEPFSLDDFVKRYALNPSDQNEWEFIKIMLDSVDRHKPETPMTASFASRGVIEKRIVLSVHKIFFY